MAFNGVLLRGAVYVIDAKKYKSIKNRKTKHVICLQQGKITERYNTFTAILINTNSLEKTKDPRNYIDKCDVHIPPEICNYEYGAVAKCAEIFTFHIQDIIKFAYFLPKEIMEEIDYKLLFGIGVDAL
ncbi:MAG: hypothetical protein Kow0037_00870 [Calditrichia bacterium]